MIRLCYSNRTEELLAALVRNVEHERELRGLLSPVRVVVPNRNVETYLRMGMARACGIAANLEVTFLRKLFARLARQMGLDGRLVEATQIEGHLLALLHDDGLLARPVLRPLHDYLLAGGSARDAVDRRRCQMAAHLAQIFDEYSNSRASMLEAWMEGPTLQDHPTLAETEAWQRELWLAIFGPAGRAQRIGDGQLRMDQLSTQLSASLGRLSSEPAELVPGSPLHLFGVSYMSLTYHRMLAALGERLDVHLYTLNPCREFWEDVQTASELRTRQRQPPSAARDDDPFDLLDAAENLALRLWGRPGRENVRLLNQMTECSFEDRFVPAGAGSPPTLLGRIQDDILDRVARKTPDPQLRADNSLRIMSCSGVRRELEIVAAEIWASMREDPTLNLNEIAVIVPESCKETYLSQVSAVFGESHDLPHSVVDLSLDNGHRLGEAIQLLVDLPFSSFSRKEVLALITHPCVMARFPEASASDWLRIVDELGIFHAAEQRDLQGSYVERDLLTWDQGLRRLALGAFMQGMRSGDETPVTIGEEQYLPAELMSTDEPGARDLALLVRSLISDARFAAGITGPALRPLSDWLTFIDGLLSAYLTPADESEDALLDRCRSAISDLQDLPLGDQPVGYRIAAELTRRAVASVSGARGQYLASGVTVASFVPMRAVPFRVLFVLGLGQANFPRPARRGDLDLREARREPGDVTPREQDLYMFLETLLCVRERLVLSYVGRDEITGEPIPPSAAIQELTALLAEGYLERGELDHLTQDQRIRQPLRRHEDLPRLFALPHAQREHVAHLLGCSLRQALPAGTSPPNGVAELRRLLAPASLTALAPHLALSKAAHAQARPASRVEISLADLRYFLEDPLQGSARFRLRMREALADHELMDREDEAFDTPSRARTILLREAMSRALLAAPSLPEQESLDASYEELSRQCELAGRGPVGFLRTAERGAHRAILQGWRQHLEQLTNGEAPNSRILHFGRTAEHQSVSEQHPPLVLDGEIATGAAPTRLHLEIVGRTQLIVSSRHAARSSLILCCRVERDSDLLRAFLDHMVMSASGSTSAADGHGAIVLLAPGKRPVLKRFKPISGERARAYLRDLACDLVTGAVDADGAPTGLHAYLMPFTAILKARRQGTSIQRAVRDLERASSSNGERRPWLGPVPRAAARSYAPPQETAAKQMENLRFGLFFELLESAK